MKPLYDLASGRFYDAWESASPAERESRRRRDLEEYVRFAAERSPFYRERLSAFDARAEHPLAKVPALTPDEARAQLPPQGRGLLASDEGHTVFQSGGTTGAPKSTLFSHEELDRLDLPNARGFYALGLTKEDRVGNLFASGSLYMTFIHINRMLQRYGCVNFPFTNHTDPEFLHSMVRIYGVNALAGIASVVLDALRAMEARGGVRVEKIFYGGEHLYEADRREIQEKFGTRLIAAPGYGTVDTWYIGYQCLRCPVGGFHAHDDQCFIEIVDEDSGEHAPAGRPGMLYATALPRRLTPVIRYRVGDRAQWDEEPCPCGRSTPVFRLLGRGDDVLRIGYDSVDYGAVQDCALAHAGLSGTIQMEKVREQGRDRLIVRVESEAPESERPILAEAFARSLLDSRPSLGSFVKKGTVWAPRVELVRPGALRRNPRTGKLVRVIDAKLQ